MPIKIGNKSLGAIKIGDREVSKVMIGDQIAYENATEGLVYTITALYDASYEYAGEVCVLGLSRDKENDTLSSIVIPPKVKKEKVFDAVDVDTEKYFKVTAISQYFSDFTKMERLNHSSDNSDNPFFTFKEEKERNNFDYNNIKKIKIGKNIERIETWLDEDNLPEVIDSPESSSSTVETYCDFKQRYYEIIAKYLNQKVISSQGMNVVFNAGSTRTDDYFYDYEIHRGDTIVYKYESGTEFYKRDFFVDDPILKNQDAFFCYNGHETIRRYYSGRLMPCCDTSYFWSYSDFPYIGKTDVIYGNMINPFYLFDNSELKFLIDNENDNEFFMLDNNKKSLFYKKSENDLVLLHSAEGKCTYSPASITAYVHYAYRSFNLSNYSSEKYEIILSDSLNDYYFTSKAAFSDYNFDFPNISLLPLLFNNPYDYDFSISKKIKFTGKIQTANDAILYATGVKELEFENIIKDISYHFAPYSFNGSSASGDNEQFNSYISYVLSQGHIDASLLDEFLYNTVMPEYEENTSEYINRFNNLDKLHFNFSSSIDSSIIFGPCSFYFLNDLKIIQISKPESISMVFDSFIGTETESIIINDSIENWFNISLSNYTEDTYGNGKEKSIFYPNAKLYIDSSSNPNNYVKEVTIPTPNNSRYIAKANFAGYKFLDIVNYENKNSNIYETVFHEYCFANCQNLKTVNITSLSNWCDTTFENEYSNPLWNEGKLYENSKLVTSDMIQEIDYFNSYCLTKIQNEDFELEFTKKIIFCDSCFAYTDKLKSINATRGASVGCCSFSGSALNTFKVFNGDSENNYGTTFSKGSLYGASYLNHIELPFIGLSYDDYFRQTRTPVIDIFNNNTKLFKSDNTIRDINFFIYDYRDENYICAYNESFKKFKISKNNGDLPNIIMNYEIKRSAQYFQLEAGSFSEFKNPLEITFTAPDILLSEDGSSNVKGCFEGSNVEVFRFLDLHQNSRNTRAELGKFFFKDCDNLRVVTMGLVSEAPWIANLTGLLDIKLGDYVFSNSGIEYVKLPNRLGYLYDLSPLAFNVVVQNGYKDIHEHNVKTIKGIHLEKGENCLSEYFTYCCRSKTIRDGIGYDDTLFKIIRDTTYDNYNFDIKLVLHLVYDYDSSEYYSSKINIYASRDSDTFSGLYSDFVSRAEILYSDEDQLITRLNNRTVKLALLIGSYALYNNPSTEFYFRDVLFDNETTVDKSVFTRESRIEKYAFAYSNIRRINIFNKELYDCNDERGSVTSMYLTTIEDYAFFSSEIGNLEQHTGGWQIITLRSVHTVGTRAFSKSNIKKVEFLNTGLDKYGFNNKTYKQFVKYFTLGTYAFADCSNLSDFYYSVDLSGDDYCYNNNATFKSYCFSGCSNLKIFTDRQFIGVNDKKKEYGKYSFIIPYSAGIKIYNDKNTTSDLYYSIRINLVTGFNFDGGHFFPKEFINEKADGDLVIMLCGKSSPYNYYFELGATMFEQNNSADNKTRYFVCAADATLKLPFDDPFTNNKLVMCIDSEFKDLVDESWTIKKKLSPNTNLKDRLVGSNGSLAIWDTDGATTYN